MSSTLNRPELHTMYYELKGFVKQLLFRILRDCIISGFLWTGAQSCLLNQNATDQLFHL